MTYQPNGRRGAVPASVDYGWNPLSAETIRRMEFRETQIGRRGLRPDDVEAFKARIAREVEQWRVRFERERSETERLTNWYRDNGVDIERPRGRTVTLEATHLLINAQRQADQVLRDAHQQASHVHADATRYAEELIDQARGDIDRAAHQYRATAGDTYSAEREDLVRWRAWAESLLLLLQATQANLGVTTEELTRRLADLKPGTDPEPRPGAWPQPVPVPDRRVS
jgi:cell division septum initiation protein DivIVA